jgi:hypothetical protein
MSLIQILSYSQKKEFEIPPVLSNEVRNEIFTIPEILFKELQSFKSDANQSLFIALYGYFKLNRIFYPISSFASDDITYIQKQYRHDDYISSIPTRPTINHYKTLIRNHFGYKSPDDTLRQILIDAANKLITQLSTPKSIFYALVELSIEKRYEVPSYTFLSKIITDAMNQRRNTIFHKLQSNSSHTALTPLELLLQTDETIPGRYMLSRFKKFSHSLKPSKIKEEVRTFETLRNIHSSISEIVGDIGIEENTALHYAQWVEKSDMHQNFAKPNTSSSLI